MPMLLAAAFSDPVSRTPMHRLAMPRPNTELLSVSGLTTESLTIGFSLVSLLMKSPSVPLVCCYSLSRAARNRSVAFSISSVVPSMTSVNLMGRPSSSAKPRGTS